MSLDSLAQLFSFSVDGLVRLSCDSNVVSAFTEFEIIFQKSKMGTPEDVASGLWHVSHWPFVPVLTRLGLAVAIGLFIGLEREHRGKNGVRTFALTALLGCLGGLMGDIFSAIAMGFVAMTAV